MTYADSYNNTYQFFEAEETWAFIHRNKEYAGVPRIRFYQQDFTTPFPDLGTEFDLVISQYAGFVGQAAKPYLKPGGLLVCNNSHGDASMASIDPAYALIAVYRRQTDTNFSISENNLEEYLQPKHGVQPTPSALRQSMQGIAYTKSPSGYIFTKVPE